MPRAQALDSIRAFSGLRFVEGSLVRLIHLVLLTSTSLVDSDRIKDYLRPLAESGTSISAEHIQSFFAAERERNGAGQR